MPVLSREILDVARLRLRSYSIGSTLFLPIPNSKREGISLGGASLELETRYEEKVHPALSGMMILGGRLDAMAITYRRSHC